MNENDILSMIKAIKTKTGNVPGRIYCTEKMLEHLREMPQYNIIDREIYGIPIHVVKEGTLEDDKIFCVGDTMDTYKWYNGDIYWWSDIPIVTRYDGHCYKPIPDEDIPITEEEFLQILNGG